MYMQGVALAGQGCYLCITQEISSTVRGLCSSLKTGCGFFCRDPWPAAGVIRELSTTRCYRCDSWLLPVRASRCSQAVSRSACKTHPVGKDSCILFTPVIFLIFLYAKYLASNLLMRKSLFKIVLILLCCFVIISEVFYNAGQNRLHRRANVICLGQDYSWRDYYSLLFTSFNKTEIWS